MWAAITLRGPVLHDSPGREYLIPVQRPPFRLCPGPDKTQKHHQKSSIGTDFPASSCAESGQKFSTPFVTTTWQRVTFRPGEVIKSEGSMVMWSSSPEILQRVGPVVHTK